MILALAAAQATDPAGGRILGEWRGSSVCTSLELTPACKDETVRYLFTGPLAGTNTYHLVADRLVSGSYETMYEMDFEYAGAADTWTHEFDAPGCAKCRWWYRIETSGLVGGVTNDSGDTLRKVSAIRHAP